MRAKPWENKSGCSDPTAYAATKMIEEENQQITDLVRTIKYITRLAGFEITNRIEFRNRNTGRMHR